MEHRLQLIESGGIHEAIVLAFDATLANAEPEAFIQKLITVNPQGLASVSVGADWTFGKGRRGNVSLLRQLGMACGFEVSAQPLVEVEGRRVSSTAIRLAISQGDLASATAMLGRPFTLLGTVVPGRRLGREIGFPTANLETGALMPPASGVYAVRVELPLGGSRNGVANLGWRPTVEGPAGGRPDWRFTCLILTAISMERHWR
ncbi:MAG: riboflavin kinase [Verrucomicrobiales bacterium]